ncbi:metal ABC transporter solute-binding protein, Zn/Mn family [Paeniglutamicibacter sp. Y32M11]|uniref:metal ABC transporter solute-binding protein, Zn/Mn family n=1 Tax=Paeniglutamicibacter sp. Y32M11 TaxID=2853258 RepID=UPI001C52E8B2|nr:zinc ABC transporter substrate-binding protein [Paeniglutamicibacter sp. Y32M11]QXQ09121.1 zinc ABC transporter substrate-binding protein [Paeniglutamicibacter sp. Y32M11]
MNKPIRAITLAISLLLLPGCAATVPPGQDRESANDGEITVVASTSVYADVARAVGGNAVSVSALIDRTSQDPHSYEATARDKLAVAKADVVIANGGGYDPFIDALSEVPQNESGAVIHAIDFHDDGDSAAGSPATEGAATADHEHAEGNEHVWYDVRTVGSLARGLAAEYSKLRPERATEFTAAAADFDQKIQALLLKIDSLSGGGTGREFAMTEPLPFYLLTEAGLKDGTPQGVSAAMEAGDDLSPLLLNKLTDSLNAKRYALLAVNTQTSGAQTDQVVAAARAAGVPVLELTETLPEGQDYISWMESNVQQLEVSLAGK